MTIHRHLFNFALAAGLLFAGIITATETRELSWEDLIPQRDLFEPLEPSGDGPDFQLNEDSVDITDMAQDPFSPPAYSADVVEALNGTQVKLPGFVVPLEIAGEGKVKEFLLVPYFGACIHLPAPPPNQIVFVTAPEPIELESMWEPVWVAGEITAQPRESDFGAAGYSMTAKSVEVYEY